MNFVSRELSGWGKYPKAVCNIYKPKDIEQARRSITKDKLIPRGLGRSYNDASLNDTGFVSETMLLDKFIDFDEQTGLLKCESGVSLDHILRIFVPRGWFLPVSPGTKFVTIGGAAASDVHGKNHHIEGSISRHIKSLTLILQSGEIVSCSPGQNEDLFWATLGGMGLTGLILNAEIYLKKIETAYIRQRTIKCSNIDNLLQNIENSEKDYEYSAAWIDASARGRNLGRGLLFVGNHAVRKDLPPKLAGQPLCVFHRSLGLPAALPSFFFNSLFIKGANASYNFVNKQKDSIVNYDKFFYPLDSITNWNMAYGSKGFVQYQLVIPGASGTGWIKEIFELIAASKAVCSLAVLKKMGKQEGILSFPMEGYTLALDFPQDEKLKSLIDQFNNIAIRDHGRVYLTKDAFLDEKTFKAMYDGKWDKWLDIKNKYDPEGFFSSNLSRRIGLCRY